MTFHKFHSLQGFCFFPALSTFLRRWICRIIAGFRTFEKLSKPNFNQNIFCLIRYLLLRLRSSDKRKSGHAAERAKFFRGQCKQTMCFRRVGWNDEAVIFLEPRKVFRDWAIFESIHRGSFNLQVRFPSGCISFEAIERFLLIAMLKSLCLRH